MSFRPSFTEVKIVGDKVHANGLSVHNVDAIREIFVGLHQGDRMEYQPVLDVTSEWTAQFDVVDPSGDGKADFAPGALLAFGIELQVNPLRAVTWTESVEIAQKV